MKIFPLLSIGLLAIALSSCKKDKNTPENNDVVTSSQVLEDFAQILANPNYQDIQSKANILNTAVLNLNTETTDSNLTVARLAWRNTRQAWESCEGYLFGPVEDFNYDPKMDDWPVNKVDLDSLLASNNPLTVDDIDALPTSLKGFHPIEYMLFGVGGKKKATDFTDRQKQYMVSLTQSLYTTSVALRNSWDPDQQDNFTEQLVTAGNGSTRFSSQKDAFIAIITAMSGICDEVANSKMEEPLIAQDSTLDESQFSHNSTADFQNNITGIRNAYYCQYNEKGRGLHDIVAAKNLSLDNKITSQISAAVNSFNSIDSNYGAAIYSQQVQIHNAQNAINQLNLTIANDLMAFVQTYIKD